METVLTKTEPTGKEFRPKARFLVSLHGTFTGDVFVYCVPNENFIAEADRVDCGLGQDAREHTHAIRSVD